MKTYVINLESAKDRYTYMSNLLSVIPQLDVEFIKAVDGRKLSEGQRNTLFDIDSFKKRRHVEIKPGEIGCTLSHYKCYQRFLRSSEEYCLILEDDIDRPNENLATILEAILGLDKNRPTIILLSDWYWYYSQKKFTNRYKLAKIYNAYLTHAYVINREAAAILNSIKPDHVADEWRYIRSKGITVYAVYPHLINQVWDGRFESSISEIQSKGIDTFGFISIRDLPYKITQYILKKTGRFYGPH